mmetsp:Transcript_2840/g.6157  ORF Transcript_2840/g.6157 Transcript_2840/m.6157 type:complete len:157 (+) Transcript_2840:201-671(+)
MTFNLIHSPFKHTSLVFERKDSIVVACIFSKYRPANFCPEATPPKCTEIRSSVDIFNIRMKSSQFLPKAVYNERNKTGVPSTAHGGRAPEAARSKPAEIIAAPSASTGTSECVCNNGRLDEMLLPAEESTGAPRSAASDAKSISARVCGPSRDIPF